ncbi:MAG: hypothetical protein ACOX1X_00735 [Dethiobacteria bacterium]
MIGAGTGDAASDVWPTAGTYLVVGIWGAGKVAALLGAIERWGWIAGQPGGKGKRSLEKEAMVIVSWRT